MHRVVKEVLEKLIFSCPRCQNVKRTYDEIFKHIQACQGSDPNKDQLALESFNKVEKSDILTKGAIDSIPLYSELLIYIMEKDSKKFYIYNSKTQSVNLYAVNTPSNFPHNF
jgi:hypothetical protein